MMAEITQREIKAQDERAIIFFDIDNTLYSASTHIAEAMGQRIHAYFTGLGLSDEQATELHLKYYRTYGLALRGLVRHHNVDTLDFDKRCDGSLPLETMLQPDPLHRTLLQDIDRSKARVWALTNAYVTHARRVLQILDLEDQMEGVIYCDYSERNFYCKPEPEYFQAALRKAGVTDPSKCYFVDDSKTNIDAARRLGWGHCVHFCERGLQTMEGGIQKQIMPSGSTSDLENRMEVSTLEELRTVWPEIFKPSTADTLKP